MNSSFFSGQVIIRSILLPICVQENFVCGFAQTETCVTVKHDQYARFFRTFIHQKHPISHGNQNDRTPPRRHILCLEYMYTK